MNKTKKLKKNKTYNKIIKGGSKNKSKPKSKPRTNIKGIVKPVRKNKTKKTEKEKQKEEEKYLLGFSPFQPINVRNQQDENEEEEEEELCDLFKSEVEQFNISERNHHFNIIPNIFYVILQLNNIEFTDPEFELIFLNVYGENPEFVTLNATAKSVVDAVFSNIATDAAAGTLSAFSSTAAHSAAAYSAASHTHVSKIVSDAFTASSEYNIPAFETIKAEINSHTIADQLQSLFDYYIFENVDELTERVSGIVTQIFVAFRPSIVYIDTTPLNANKTKVSADSDGVQAFSLDFSRAIDVGVGNPNALEIIRHAEAIRAHDVSLAASTNNFIVNSQEVVNIADRSFLHSKRIVTELTARAVDIRGKASDISSRDPFIANVESIETITKSITDSNDVFVANKAIVMDLLSRGAGNAAARGDAIAISTLSSPISNIADATSNVLNDYNALQSISNGFENDFTLLNDEYIEYLYYYFKENNLDHTSLYRLIPIIIIGFLFSCDRDHIKTSLYVNYDFTILDGPFPSLNEFTLTIYLIILKTIGIGGRLNTIQIKIILMLICKRLNFV